MTATHTWLAESLDDLPEIALAILAKTGDRRILTFTGDLGAGKTTLIQSLCRELGVTENVASPTYALAHQYAYLDRQGRRQYVHHLDLYRLKSLEEALEIGIEEYLFDPGYCFIEWPEIIRPLLPAETAQIMVEIASDSGRKIVLLTE